MEDMNIKLMDGEVAVVMNGMNVIMNTNTLLDLCDKLGVDTKTDLVETLEKKCESKCNCTCNCKKKDTCTCENKENKNDSSSGYVKLAKAILDETTDDEKTSENTDNETVEAFYDFLNDINGFLDGMLSGKKEESEDNEEDEEEDDEEYDNEEYDEDDFEDEELDKTEEHSSGRIVAVMYDPYHLDKDWRDGLKQVLGTFDTIRTAADQYGIDDQYKVKECADTWKAAGALLHNKFITRLVSENRETVADYAEDEYAIELDPHIYCAPNCSGFHPKKDGIAFMWEEYTKSSMPIYHKELLNR